MQCSDGGILGKLLFAGSRIEGAKLQLNTALRTARAPYPHARAPLPATLTSVVMPERPLCLPQLQNTINSLGLCKAVIDDWSNMQMAHSNAVPPCHHVCETVAQVLRLLSLARESVLGTPAPWPEDCTIEPGVLNPPLPLDMHLSCYLSEGRVVVRLLLLSPITAQQAAAGRPRNESIQPRGGLGYVMGSRDNWMEVTGRSEGHVEWPALTELVTRVCNLVHICQRLQDKVAAFVLLA